MQKHLRIFWLGIKGLWKLWAFLITWASMWILPKQVVFCFIAGGSVGMLLTAIYTYGKGMDDE